LALDEAIAEFSVISQSFICSEELSTQQIPPPPKPPPLNVNVTRFEINVELLTIGDDPFEHNSPPPLAS